MDDDEVCPDCDGVFDVDEGDCENQCSARREQERTEQALINHEKAAFRRKYYT